MNHSVTYLRVLAALAVIILHSSSMFLFTPLGSDWLIGNVFDSLTRFCVPLFIMISGALLLSKDEDSSFFFKKRATKILVPFLFWSVFYYLYKINYDISEINLVDFSKSFIKGGIFYHLWYFYLLIPLYLITPLLRKIVQTSSVKTMIGYIVFFVLLENICDFIMLYTSVNPKNFFGEIFVYIAYFITGYLVFSKRILDKYKWQTYLLGIISIFTIICGTYALSNEKGSFEGFLYQYTALPVFLCTVAIILFFISQKKLKSNFIIDSIAKHSFGIYLVHAFILDRVRMFLDTYEINAFYYISLSFVITLCLSYIILLVISKIPILKKTI